MANDRGRIILMNMPFLAVGSQRENILSSMGKRAVPHVMKKSGQSNQCLIPPEPGFVVTIKGFQERFRLPNYRVVKLACNMHYPERMLKAGMHCPRINVIRPGQLANPP